MARAYNHLDVDETIDFYRQASNSGGHGSKSGRAPSRTDRRFGQAPDGGNHMSRHSFSRPNVPDEDDERSRGSDEGSEYSDHSRGSYHDFDDARSDRSGRSRSNYDDFDDARSDRSGNSRSSSRNDGSRSHRSAYSRNGGENDGGRRSSDRHDSRNGPNNYNGRGQYRDYDDDDNASVGPFGDDSRSSSRRSSRGLSGRSSSGGGGGRKSGKPNRSNKGEGGNGDQWYFGEFADDGRSGSDRYGNSSSGGNGGGGAESASLLAGAGGGEAVRLTSTHAQGSPCSVLALALVLVAVGMAGGQVFLRSGVVHYPHDYTAFSNAAATTTASTTATSTATTSTTTGTSFGESGFTWLELSGLLAQTLLLPMGLSLLVVAASQATTHLAWSPLRKSATLASLSVCLFAASIVALWANGLGGDLVGCVTWPQLCTNSHAAKSGGVSGFVLWSGVAYAIISLLFAFLLAKLAAHSTRPAPSPLTPLGNSPTLSDHNNSGNSSRSAAGGKEPSRSWLARNVIDLEGGSSSSSPSSDSLVAHQKLAAWERKVRAIAAVAVIILILLPFAVLGCAFFSSQIEQVDAWELDRQAAIDAATSATAIDGDDGAVTGTTASAESGAAVDTVDSGSSSSSDGASTSSEVDATLLASSKAAVFSWAPWSNLEKGAPLLTVQASHSLTLKLTLDVALFYGALYLVVLIGALVRLWPAAQACLARPPPRVLVLWHPSSKPRAGAAASFPEHHDNSSNKSSSSSRNIDAGGVRLDLQASGSGQSCGDSLLGSALFSLWPPSVATTMSEWFLLVLLTALLVAEFAYWFLAFPFPCASLACVTKYGTGGGGITSGGSGVVPTAERFARALGQLGACVMGLLVLPVARNSLLAPALGVSWDKALAAHNFLGFLFLAVGLGHQATWWFAERTVYASTMTAINSSSSSSSSSHHAGSKGNSILESALLPLPFSAYDPSNWAIPLQAAVLWISFLLLGCFSLAAVRRRAWRLFRWAHHFSLALFVATLWHARGSWQYVGGGLLLWLLDCLLRVGGNARRVMVHSLAAMPTDDSPQGSEVDGFGDDDSGGVTVLKYTVHGCGAWRDSPHGRGCAGGVIQRCCLNGSDGGGSSVGGGSGGGGGYWPTSESGGAPLDHLPTQFVLINVPALSPWEWHPISISSAPGDSVTTHHIKARGRHSWSGKLLALSRQAAAGSVDTSDLVIKVEGPYGVPPPVRRRTAVLLVAGGIGATPLHALFRTLYLEACVKAPRYKASRFDFPELVRLVWVAPNEQIFDLFLGTLHEVMVNDLNGRFSFRLHATKALRPGYTHGASDSSNVSNSSNAPSSAPSSNRSNSSSRSSGGRRGRRRDKGLAVPQLPYEPGRPSLETEFRRVEQFGAHALVYCCGPASLQRDCQALAHAAGVDYRADGFEL